MYTVRIDITELTGNNHRPTLNSSAKQSYYTMYIGYVPTNAIYIRFSPTNAMYIRCCCGNVSDKVLRNLMPAPRKFNQAPVIT